MVTKHIHTIQRGILYHTLIALVLGLCGSCVGQPTSLLSSSRTAFQHCFCLLTPNAACSKEWGQFSSSQILGSGSPTFTRSGPALLFCFAQARCRTLSPDCSRRHTRGWQAQFSCFYTQRAGSLIPLTTGLALGCCPGKVQVLVSHELQLVRGRASSATLMTQGKLSCLSQVAKDKEGGASFSYPCHDMADEGVGSEVSSAALMTLGLAYLDMLYRAAQVRYMPMVRGGAIVPQCQYGVGSQVSSED